MNGTPIVVRDHGPGFPDELLAAGPQCSAPVRPSAATATAWA